MPIKFNKQAGDILSSRFQRMYEFPLQDPNNFCAKCEWLKKAYAEKQEGVLTRKTLGDMRIACTKCRGAWSKPMNGIYKADAILGAYKPSKPVLPVGKGRQPVLARKYGAIIQNLKNEGMSQRKIARVVGISLVSVNKILGQNRVQSVEKKSDSRQRI